ncbi:hypothetical protein [Paenibacillus xerothermodurans]|uniref:WYL domain-containing protein n=1 Tax=Paenibacillus xerothermodurans TaxID=1977292 RepID=A0A2W1NSV9_PAEXE|nr:hypothetical protein [Paenibacillus xerothermodurans]PZE22595.1 hypothetical protein CBW46_002125 [Paenibacillus xerothermodurans]
MAHKLERYIGHTVEIMYIDRHGTITHRFIQIHSVKGNYIRAHCFSQGKPRIFSIANILAVSLAEKKSSV